LGSMHNRASAAHFGKIAQHTLNLCKITETLVPISPERLLDNFNLKSVFQTQKFLENCDNEPRSNY
jgi:hypothetical protein